MAENIKHCCISLVPSNGQLYICSAALVGLFCATRTVFSPILNNFHFFFLLSTWYYLKIGLVFWNCLCRSFSFLKILSSISAAQSWLITCCGRFIWKLSVNAMSILRKAHAVGLPIRIQENGWRLWYKNVVLSPFITKNCIHIILCLILRRMPFMEWAIQVATWSKILNCLFIKWNEGCCCF